jgi:hypothetical protein
MAKAAPKSYQVTDKSPLTYNGKRAMPSDVVTDIPGEDISWLLEGGYIVPVESAPEPQPVEVSAVEVEAPPVGEVETITETITVKAGEAPVVETTEATEPDPATTEAN